ncbi:MAG: glycosyltransferase family 4 protein [Patescibacteria group bacterium]
MKRALIFSLNYHPFIGGAEVAIREITDRIPERDIEFHLIAYRFDSLLPKTERIGQVVVHRVGIGRPGMTTAESFGMVAYLGKVLYAPLAAIAALALHRKHRFDFVWCMMAYMVFPVVLMRMMGVRIPYVLTLQEGDPFEHVFNRPHIQLVSPLLFYGIRRAAAIQTISRFLATWARRCGYEGTIVVIPNGVDVGRFSSVVHEPGIGTRLVTMSRLVHKNGIDTVIRALTLLPHDTTFTIYGDGPLRGELQALAASCKVADRVTFAGAIEHTRLTEELGKADIFIRASRSEGMGNAFIEAMAAGLPTIGTPVGGITDFLTDVRHTTGEEATGWFVAPDAPQDIADAVRHIQQNPEIVDRVTRKARRMVMEKYEWNLVAHDMQDLFRTITP